MRIYIISDGMKIKKPKNKGRHRVGTELTQPGLRHEKWSGKMGQGYGLNFKRATVVPFFTEMEKQGHLGKVIVDVGSGSIKQVDTAGIKRSGVFYPIEGRKIVRVDIGFGKRFQKHKNIAEVRADVEESGIESRYRNEMHGKLADFLGVNKGSGLKQADTIIMSDVLNYVDWRKSIKAVSAYLKKGGRIVINNQVNKGNSAYFSSQRPMKNSEVIDFFKKEGFEIEHVSRGWDAPILYPNPDKGSLGNYEEMVLVARKK